MDMTQAVLRQMHMLQASIETCSRGAPSLIATSKRGLLEMGNYRPLRLK